jgi:hypothetical protein
MRPSEGVLVDRRAFISTVAGTLLAAPLVAEAQQAGKVYRIGVLETTPVAMHAANLDAFRQGLRELGYVERQNYAIEYRYQRAAVAGGAVQPAFLHALARGVLCADRIVRAQRAHPQRLGEMVFEVAGPLHEAAEGPVRVRTPGIEQDPEAIRLPVGVNPLAEGTCGVAAAHGERLDQEVGERVQQHVGTTGEWALALASFIQR